jgi:hypothetical protein
MIDALRVVHDHAPLNLWKTELKDLAADHGLEWNHD